MFQSLSASEFYDAVLSKSGIERIDDEALDKTAAVEQKLPVEQVKLAKAFYEELQKDDSLRITYGMQPVFAEPELRQAEGYKLAAAFVAHRYSVAEKAAAAADRLLEKLSAAAAEWAKDAGVVGIAPDELVKIAALQAESAVAFEEHLAFAAHEDAAKTASFAKVATGPFDPQTFYLTDKHSPQSLNLDAAKQTLGATVAAKINAPLPAIVDAQGQPLPAGEKAYAARVNAHADAHMADMGLADEAMQRVHLNNMLVNAHNGNHMDFLRASNEVHAARIAPKPSWLSTPMAKRTGMIGGGLLAGAGAVGLIRHFNKNRAAAEQRDANTAIQNTAALPAQ